MRTTMLLVALLLSGCSTELPTTDDAALAALRTTAGPIPATDDVFHGCYKQHSNANETQGDLRLVSDASSCRSNEVAVSWNATGATGPQGPAGPAGPAGADGAPGIDGIDGIDGVDGTDGADGEQGPVGPQGAVGPQGPPGVTPPAAGPCLPGRTLYFDTGECLLCPAGTFSATGAACEYCPAFAYASVEGAAQCTECGGGAIANPFGTACEMCPADTYRVAGQGFCAPCPSGTTSAPGAVECI